jgi:hypothetical protein
MRASLLLVVLLVSVLAASCSLLSTFGATEQVSCSVGGGNRFDPQFLNGPDMTPAEFAATPVGSMLQTFFVGGEGAPENDAYTVADGFSIVSKSYVLGYLDGLPISDFYVEPGDIQGWGGCNPTWVDGDTAAGRWHPAESVDPMATLLPITVEGGACVEQDGTNIITEVVEIEVAETSDTVEIIAWTREKGFQGMCAGIGIDLPAEATLDAPLGTRTLLDAGRIPPIIPDL